MTLNDLLEKGYFPKELPPPFNTKQFSAYFETKSNFKGYKGNENKSNYAEFSIPKLNFSRTKVAIINPYNYLVLAEVIKNNWNKIEVIYNGSTITTSLPAVNTNSFKTTKSFREFKEIALVESLGKDIMLKTDVARFYSSIYTHSIPWAIHTKAVAKNDRGNTLFGNVLDASIRNCQDQQTNGIPIGPITSLIVAEILLTSIDKQLVSAYSLKGKRYIDDYMLFFDNSINAEEFLQNLQMLLMDFQLEINNSKTTIEKLPYELEEIWLTELSTFFATSSSITQKLFLTKLYSKVLTLVKKYPNKFVIKYLIHIVMNYYIEDENWVLFQTYLLNLTRLEPSILPETLKIILSYHKVNSFSLQEIKKFYVDLINVHILKGNHFEVTWSLWSLVELNQKIDASLADIVLSSDDSCSKLIILHMKAKNLIDGNLTNLQMIQGNIQSDDLYNKKWLFTYESFNKNWLSVNTGLHPVLNDTFFKKLHDNNISFYDETIKVEQFDIEELKVNDLTNFQFDSSVLIDRLDNMRSKISDAENFDEIKDTYQDLLSVFSEFIEDTNEEFADHIKKLVKKKEEYE